MFSPQCPKRDPPPHGYARERGCLHRHLFTPTRDDGRFQRRQFPSPSDGCGSRARRHRLARRPRILGYMREDQGPPTLQTNDISDAGPEQDETRKERKSAPATIPTGQTGGAAPTTVPPDTKPCPTEGNRVQDGSFPRSIGSSYSPREHAFLPLLGLHASAG